MKKIAMWALIASTMHLKAHAQISKKDTVYYLVDTAKTPINDRILNSGIEGAFKYYSIQCPCLKNNSYPTFVYNLTDKGSSMSKRNFSKITLISLAKLINIAKRAEENLSDTSIVLYFIEHSKTKYVKHRVRLFSVQKRQPSIDTEIIK